MPEKYTAVATKAIEVSPTVRRYFLRLEGPKPLEFKAGQFIMADLTKPGGGKHMRSYSVASPPHQKDPVELIIKYVDNGVASEFFWNSLKEGDSFSSRGPFGAFVMKEPLPGEVMFVATGTGVAPLRSMIHHLYHTGEGQKRKIWLFLGIRYETEILYDDEWKELAAKHNFVYIPTISRPKNWSGEVGYVQEKVKNKFDGSRETSVYSCGGDAMVKALKAVLEEKGFKKEQLHYEIW